MSENGQELIVLAIPRGGNSLKNLYLVLAVIGAILPIAAFLGVFGGEPLPQPQFWLQALYVNVGTAAAFTDLSIACAKSKAERNMQQFESDCELPQSAAEVLAAIATEQYLRYRYDEDGIENFVLEIRSDTRQRFESFVSRSLKTDRLPAVARKIAGDSMTLLQNQHWDRSTTPYRGELRMQLEGLPGHIVTRLQLIDNGDGTSTLRGQGEVLAKIPLLGKQIEKMMIGKVGEGFERSADAIREYLQRDLG